jgi:CheY-like chemotaxis protein
MCSRRAGTSLAKTHGGTPHAHAQPAREKHRKVTTRPMNATPEEFSKTNAQAFPPEPAQARASVLLAEDDRSLRRYLEVVLRRAGYDVVAAADGLEAMKAALSGTFHAVVTDALMPHLSGQELCRFLRAHPKLSRLPVVLLSGADANAAPAQDASARADAYLSKPVRPEDLTDCLARLVEANA